MANREMGEIEVTLRGDEHVFCFDLNGIISMCDRFGLESMDQLGQIGSEIQKVTNLPFFVATALRGGSVQDCTEKEAGRLVTLVGLKTAVEAIGEAFAVAVRNLESASEEAAEADPPIAGP